MDSLIIENAALKEELSEVKHKLSWLMEQVSSNRRRLYGPSSEKSVYDGVGDQIGLFHDGPSETVAVQALAPVSIQPTKAKPIKRGEMSSRLPDNLPIETIECQLPDSGQGCQVCNSHMHVIGKEVARRELKIIPAKAVIKEFVRYAYGCRNCENNDISTPIVKAPMPPQLIKGSMCSPETIAHIAVQKFVMGSPIYRQEAEWRRQGIPITRQTMNNWMIRCSEDYLEPIYDELHRRLLLHSCLHSDDTGTQVLREPGKTAQSKSYMWIYRTSGDAKYPIVLYDYQPDRKKERPRKFLDGFSGFLMTDAYAAYHSLPENIIVVGCFAHVRSGFSDALKCLKESERPGSLALVGKEFCDKLFDIERSIKDKPFDERYLARQKEAVPVLDDFYAWLKWLQPRAGQKSKLGAAVGYALNQWKYLVRYLLDGRIEISNNRCERSAKSYVINRKNFLFSTSVAGARATAVFHSLTETAKENGLNPHEFLTYVLREAAAGSVHRDSDLVRALLPENAPTECRAILLQS